MKSLSKYIGILALTLAAAFSCVKEDSDSMSPGTFKIDMDKYEMLALDQNAQVAFVPVKTNIPEDQWKFSSKIGRAHV